MDIDVRLFVLLEDFVRFSKIVKNVCEQAVYYYGFEIDTPLYDIQDIKIIGATKIKYQFGLCAGQNIEKLKIENEKKIEKHIMKIEKCKREEWAEWRMCCNHEELTIAEENWEVV